MYPNTGYISSNVETKHSMKYKRAHKHQTSKYFQNNQKISDNRFCSLTKKINQKIKYT